MRYARWARGTFPRYAPTFVRVRVAESWRTHTLIATLPGYCLAQRPRLVHRSRNRRPGFRIARMADTNSSAAAAAPPPAAGGNKAVRGAPKSHRPWKVTQARKFSTMSRPKAAGSTGNGLAFKERQARKATMQKARAEMQRMREARQQEIKVRPRAGDGGSVARSAGASGHGVALWSAIPACRAAVCSQQRPCRTYFARASSPCAGAPRAHAGEAAPPRRERAQGRQLPGGEWSGAGGAAPSHGCGLGGAATAEYRRRLPLTRATHPRAPHTHPRCVCARRSRIPPSSRR